MTSGTPGLPDPAGAHAVLVGVAGYQHLPVVPAAANNVRDLAALLTDPDVWGVPAANVHVVLDPTTIHAVTEPLHEAAQAATSALLFYFVGHGLVDDENLSLRLALVGGDSERLHYTIAYPDIRRAIGKAPRSPAKVVILDTCFSGRAMEGVLSGTSQVADQAIIKGTFLLTATNATTLGKAAKDAVHTAFTGALIRTLNDGVADGPDLLDMETVYKATDAALRAANEPAPQCRAGADGQRIAIARNLHLRPPAPQDIAALTTTPVGRSRLENYPDRVAAWTVADPDTARDRLWDLPAGQLSATIFATLVDLQRRTRRNVLGLPTMTEPWLDRRADLAVLLRRHEPRTHRLATLVSEFVAAGAMTSADLVHARDWLTGGLGLPAHRFPRLFPRPARAIADGISAAGMAATAARLLHDAPGDRAVLLREVAGFLPPDPERAAVVIAVAGPAEDSDDFGLLFRTLVSGLAGDSPRKLQQWLAGVVTALAALHAPADLQRAALNVGVATLQWRDPGRSFSAPQLRAICEGLDIDPAVRKRLFRIAPDEVGQLLDDPQEHARLAAEPKTVRTWARLYWQPARQRLTSALPVDLRKQVLDGLIDAQLRTAANVLGLPTATTPFGEWQRWLGSLLREEGDPDPIARLIADFARPGGVLGTAADLIAARTWLVEHVGLPPDKYPGLFPPRPDRIVAGLADTGLSAAAKAELRRAADPLGLLLAVADRIGPPSPSAAVVLLTTLWELDTGLGSSALAELARALTVRLIAADGAPQRAGLRRAYDAPRWVADVVRALPERIPIGSRRQVLYGGVIALHEAAPKVPVNNRRLAQVSRTIGIDSHAPAPMAGLVRTATHLRIVRLLWSWLGLVGSVDPERPARERQVEARRPRLELEHRRAMVGAAVLVVFATLFVAALAMDVPPRNPSNQPTGGSSREATPSVAPTAPSSVPLTEAPRGTATTSVP